MVRARSSKTTYRDRDMWHTYRILHSTVTGADVMTGSNLEDPAPHQHAAKPCAQVDGRRAVAHREDDLEAILEARVVAQASITGARKRVLVFCMGHAQQVAQVMREIKGVLYTVLRALVAEWDSPYDVRIWFVEHHERHDTRHGRGLTAMQAGNMCVRVAPWLYLEWYYYDPFY